MRMPSWVSTRSLAKVFFTASTARSASSRRHSNFVRHLEVRVTSGDGSSDSDEWLSGQDLSRPLSKLMRIDVDHPADGKQAGTAHRQRTPLPDRPHVRILPASAALQMTIAHQMIQVSPIQ